MRSHRPAALTVLILLAATTPGLAAPSPPSAPSGEVRDHDRRVASSSATTGFEPAPSVEAGPDSSRGRALLASSRAFAGCLYDACMICGGNPFPLGAQGCRCPDGPGNHVHGPGSCQECNDQMGASCMVGGVFTGDDWWGR